MKRVALTIGLAYLWTLIASGIFCVFNFQLFVFPYAQWWEGIYYFHNMLWLPRWRDFTQWPLFWFVDGFVIASLIVFILARMFVGRSTSKQPNLYGESKFANIGAMKEGGITTERRL
jgi:hypothetical protein